METYCKEEEAKEGTLNLTTHVQVDYNVSEFVFPFLLEVEARLSG